MGDLLFEAANLLLVGMVVVFAFLSLLIFCINLMSKLFGGEDPIPANSAVNRPRMPNQDSKARESQVTAAISAAIHQHRKK
jgi:oxaloacetate decarboxylase gamma subunit